MITNDNHPLTTEYRIKSTSDEKELPLLVFLPGNPGLIDYYVTYLNLISKQLPQYDVLAVSHAGYQTSGDYVSDGAGSNQDFYNLEYQIQHKVEILKREILNGRKRFSFLCHSVGGYVTQRVIRQLLEDESVADLVEFDFVGLICPTVVDIAKSDSGVLFTKLFSYLPLVQLALLFVGFLQLILSDAMAKRIIRKFIIAKPVLTDEKLLESWNNAVEATFKIYKSKRIARQALQLAQEELQVIHRDDEMNDWFFQKFPVHSHARMWCFFASTDYWVHDHTRDYILSRYHDQNNDSVQFQIGDSDTEHSRAITHSFCIDQTVEFAEITCAALCAKN